MPDITTVQSATTGSFDWVVSGADLASDGGLATAIVISLGTDARADEGDVIPDGSDDRRGFWADDAASGPTGSKLWLLARAKATDETLRRAHDYAAAALQWLVDDEVVARFDIAPEWTRPGLLGMRVVAHRDGAAPLALKFSSVWQGLV